VKNLGVQFDSSLKFDKQINSVVKSCFYHLRSIAKVKLFLSPSDFEKIIHAFISVRLDYCNLLYVGVIQVLLNRLQLVMNASARLLTGTRKKQHVKPVLASLNWLPVQFRIDFKLLIFVYKVLHNLAPPYLEHLLHIHKPSRSLRSANQMIIDIPRTRLKLSGIGHSLWQLQSAGIIYLYTLDLLPLEVILN